MRQQAAGVPPPGVISLPNQDNPNQKVAVRVDVDGGDLTDARAGNNPQTGDTSPSIPSARGTLADVTRQNVNHRFAIVLDGEAISAPVIREPITGGRGQISGSFTAASANDLAVLLRAVHCGGGAQCRPRTRRQLDPRRREYRLAVEFVLVVAFMATFYGMFGWFANVLLVVLMLGVMLAAGGTLTLPGLAGIVLTIGMAVDANILINERMREEQRYGRPPLSALEHGFREKSIFNSNVAAFLAVSSVVFRLRPGARVRRDHHGRHRHVNPHHLDADTPAGVALVCVAAPRSSAGLTADVHPPPRLPSGPRQHQDPVHAGPDRRPCPFSAFTISTASVVMFFYPGLGINLSGRRVMEVRTPRTSPRSAPRWQPEHIPDQRPATLRGADPARRPAWPQRSRPSDVAHRLGKGGCRG